MVQTEIGRKQSGNTVQRKRQIRNRVNKGVSIQNHDNLAYSQSATE